MRRVGSRIRCLSIACLVGCAGSAPDAAFTEAEIDATCTEYCGEQGCGPPQVSDEFRARCRQRCVEGCEVDPGCAYAGACVNELVSYRICELACRCDRGACRAHAVRFRACELQETWGQEHCEAVAACGLSRDACLNGFSIEPECGLEWALYLRCVDVDRNPAHPENLCANDFVTCTGDPCSDCAFQLDEHEGCVYAQPILRDMLGPAPECAR